MKYKSQMIRFSLLVLMGLFGSILHVFVFAALDGTLVFPGA